MAQKISQKAEEGSSFILRASFNEITPSGKVPIVPTSLKWKLTDKDGTVINNKLDQILTPDSYVYIPISGDDLALPADHPITLYVTVEGTYNSFVGGELPIVSTGYFQVENSVGIGGG